MPIKSLYLEKFRLFDSKKIELSSERSLIVGKNGSGKTSVLEAMEILFSGKSFRSINTSECINHAHPFFQIAALGLLGDKEIRLETTKFSEGRISTKRTVGGKKIKGYEAPLIQIVLGKHLRMVEGEPELRRDFVNRLMFHVKPETVNLHNTYNKALQQRNKSLRKKLPIEQLNNWTEQVLESGLLLSKEQYDFFQVFKEVSLEYISKAVISNNISFLQDINLHFISGWDTSKTIRKSFQDSLPKDMALGYTTQGPHRQDFVFSVEKKKAASNLSRGQLKLLIILMFLSSYDVINEFSSRESLLLIDDIGSELDEDNLQILFNIISSDKNQVILTAINGNFLDKINGNLEQFKRINL
jgi:DNA replication and repair protein RecF